jgi:Domain of unknown function (DUF4270)
MTKSFFGCLLCAAIAFTVLQTSCNDASSIGADLLDQDQLSVAYIDTFKIETSTVREDSVVVPYSDNFLSSYPIGVIEDPVFGSAEAGVYMEFLRNGNLVSPKDLKGATVDSVVMSLQYDSTAYGDISTPRSLEVYRVNEVISPTAALIKAAKVFSSQKYSTDATPLGARNNFVARTKYKTGSGTTEVCNDCVTITSSVWLENKKVDSLFTFKLDPHVRIRLDNKFGDEILALDTISLNTDAGFRNKLKGFYIKPTSKNAGMVNYFLTAGTTNGVTYNSQTNVTIYYKDATGRQRRYQMFSDPAAVKVSNFKHNYSQTLLNAFAKPSVGDTTIYVQALSGSNAKVTLPSLTNLKNSGVIVNKAELEFYTKPVGGLKPASQLILVSASDGKSTLLPDVLYGASNNYAAFGGKPVAVTINGVSLYKYTFNISYLAQKLIDDSALNKAFYIANNYKSEKAERTILNGGKSAQFPPKLKLYYTKVQ